MPLAKAEIYGTWELLSFEAINKDNCDDIEQPLGKECAGRMICDPGGFVSVIMQSKELAKEGLGGVPSSPLVTRKEKRRK